MLRSQFQIPTGIFPGQPTLMCLAISHRLELMLRASRSLLVIQPSSGCFDGGLEHWCTECQIPCARIDQEQLRAGRQDCRDICWPRSGFRSRRIRLGLCGLKWSTQAATCEQTRPRCGPGAAAERAKNRIRGSKHQGRSTSKPTARQR